MSDIDWRHLPSLSSLRAFELTARMGSFAAAARALNVTHAAVAQQVRGLEAELGVALARRSGRSVQLTDAGARLAASLTEGFGVMAQGIADVRRQQQAQPVQIAATVFISQSVILPRLHEFWERHPDIAVSVLPSQDLVDLVALGFDIGIRTSFGDPDWPGFDAHLLLESEVILVGAPTLVRPGMKPLDELPWIWSRGSDYDEGTIRAFGFDPAKLRNVDLGTPIFQLASARQGLGLCAATDIIVRSDLEAGTLVRLPVPSPFSVRYYAATPKGPVRPQAKVFLDWLISVIDRPAGPEGAGQGGGQGGGA
ncbi:LysR substrate-binding domain-containing protein [Chachezhania sediminis]|uniref:LysR substrate-binding domain-containing protein n=1 Tax=Chachezhania sediminis TaxID=2599291 RepID=UPI00131C3141|nr:LysR substrate-binding domain-containing protein [Chachezhania sediminis]